MFDLLSALYCTPAAYSIRTMAKSNRISSSSYYLRPCYYTFRSVKKYTADTTQPDVLDILINAVKYKLIEDMFVFPVHT